MLLQVEAAGLLCLAVALAGPVPAALARARWPTRDPRAALVLWQAVGLGGGLAILGAGLTLAAGSLDDRWLSGIASEPGNLAELGVLGWVGIALTLTVGGWLVAVTAVSTVRVVLARRAHRRRLDAVAEPVRACAGGALGTRAPGPPGTPSRRLAPSRVRELDLPEVRLVDHPHAVAYCLPGLRPRVVVSRGAIGALEGAELAAVIAHERAHARGRHDLVIQPFIAWRATFPFLAPASAAVAGVELLVEMLADDTARRTCPAQALRRALQQLSREHVALAGPGRAGLDAQLRARTSRLATPPEPLPGTARALVYLAAAALVLLPPVILLLS